MEKGGPQQIRDLNKAALQGCNYSQRNREDTNPRVQEERRLRSHHQKRERIALLGVSMRPFFRRCNVPQEDFV